MYETTTIKGKSKLFILIMMPILVTQVSMYLMNLFDTMMSGRVGAIDLAGVAIGSSLWVPIFTGINGVIIALTPIIAHLSGANATAGIARKVQQGIFLSIGLALIVIVIGAMVIDPILKLMDLEAEVRHVAKYYLVALATGIIPLFIFNTLRAFMDALGKTRTSMFVILTTLPINVFFNYIFIFGKFGVPAYGGIGSGIATAITYWISCLISLFIIIRMSHFKVYPIFSKWTKPKIKDWLEQLKIGIPIGFSIFFETSIFSAVTLFMSVYSTYTIAAHQAAISFATLLYMLPLSVGMALTIVIGYELGAKRYGDARLYGRIGIGSGIFIAIFAGIILFVFDAKIAGLYHTNPEVIQLTKHFIFYAIFYQLADGFGAPIQGALRGYKDVNITFVLSFVSYWIIGLPSGWLLANYTEMGPFGYWIGLIIGLSTGAIALLYRLLTLQKKYASGKLPATNS